ncbi:uncharacterized protein TNCV_990931 [Trichonephila clavipes]|nr:uncharacterized protein TNCV_990931 [Trichonephila clavipes]
MELRCPSQVFRHTPRATECENKGVLSTSSSGFLRENRDHYPTMVRSAEPEKKMFKNCRKEDLRIVALELGETVAEKVTIVEFTEIIKENKYFKEDVEFVKELIQYTIEDRKRVQEKCAEVFYELMLPIQFKMEGSNVNFQNTVFGFVASGSTSSGAKGKEHCGFIQTADNLELSSKKFWEIENVETDSVKTS